MQRSWKIQISLEVAARRAPGGGEGDEAVLEDADEADEITIEEIVIDSIIDKIAVGKAAYDNTAGERVDEEADEITIEEIVIDSSIEAIIDKIAGGEAVHDNTAGEIVAISDKAGERDEVILKAAERVKEFIVEPSAEAILEAVEESRLYVWPPKEVKGPRIESRPQ